jgi:transposase
LALIDDFDREIDTAAKEIDRQAKADERVALLCQIHGISRYTAMLIIAEIGDVRRFPTARRPCAWAGLTPTVRSSDNKARLGSISGQGSSILRWALVEAATHLPTRGGPLRQQFERIAKRRGRKSPASPPPDRSSHSATTACATARSASSKLPVRRAP